MKVLGFKKLFKVQQLDILTVIINLEIFVKFIRFTLS